MSGRQPARTSSAERIAQASDERAGSPDRWPTFGDVKELVYSACLDGDTCETCARLDGMVFPADYDEEAPGAVRTPHPGCTSPRGCQCVWVAVLISEAPSQGPPTRRAE